LQENPWKVQRFSITCLKQTHFEAMRAENFNGEKEARNRNEKVP
jgi:hypothetical protein